MFFQLYFFAEKPKNLDIRTENKKGRNEQKWSLSLVEMIFPTKYQKIRIISTDKRCAILKNITPTT